ncbi:lipase family protein [Ramlibacter sp. AN1133]|uniref:lipase family protein n=1 Tax=Ramlibacter sp. AN1133 TaxID=3133429 RepID=UPI0030BB4D95
MTIAEGAVMTGFTGAIGAAVLLLYLLVLSGCASFRQKSDEVWQRPSGGELAPLEDAKAAIRTHLPYAWASLAAYQRPTEPECAEPHAFLRSIGWTRWLELPQLLGDQPFNDPEMRSLAQAMREQHLRVEVWSRPPSEGRSGEVIVAFGGTEFRNLQDWKANLHWVGAWFGAQDQYELISSRFVPAFAREFRRRQQRPDEAWLASARITPTGHSLGGGLAQRFAYDVWDELKLPADQLRVREIYSFDPSPVSGKRTSPSFQEHKDETLRYKGLKIYRIYNRGEILATVRSILHFGNLNPDLNEQGQNWIDIRYKDNWSWRTLLPDGWVHAHGMESLACFMAKEINVPVMNTPGAASSVPARAPQ